MTWTLDGARHMLQFRATVMSSRYAQAMNGRFPALPNRSTYWLPHNRAGAWGG